MKVSALLASACALFTAVSAQPIVRREVNETLPIANADNTTVVDYFDDTQGLEELADANDLFSKRSFFHRHSQQERIGDFCAKEVTNFHIGPHSALGYEYYKDNKGHLKLKWVFAFDKKISFNILKVKVLHHHSWKQIFDVKRWHLGFHFDWDASNWIEISEKPIEFSITFDKEGEVFYSTDCSGKSNCNPIHIPKLAPKCEHLTKREEEDSSVEETLPEAFDSEYQVEELETFSNETLFYKREFTNIKVDCIHEVTKFAQGPHSALGFYYYKDNHGKLNLKWYFAYDRKINFNILKIKFHHNKSWKEIFNVKNWRLGFHFHWRANEWVDFVKKPVEFTIDYEKLGEITYSTDCHGKANCNPIPFPSKAPKYCYEN